MSRKEIFVEFITLGNSVKATAIDPVSGLEAAVIGPARASRMVLMRAAERKLEYLLRKKTKN